MATEHEKTWEGAGWMLSLRDNGHNDNDNAPTHAPRNRRLDISFKSRPASLHRADFPRRNNDSDGNECRQLSAPYGEDARAMSLRVSSLVVVHLRERLNMK
jgi:hypothetical protein